MAQRTPTEIRRVHGAGRGFGRKVGHGWAGGLKVIVALVVAGALVGRADAAPNDPELAALNAMPVPDDGRSWVEKPRVVKPLRPEEALATWSFDLDVPVGRQIGDKTNCGPTTAAMALGAFKRVAGPAVRDLRDAVGEWTWQTFPMRQLRLAGYDAGMTTRHMMKASLERYEPAVQWAPVEHRWLPPELWSIIAMKQAVSERRPLVVLAEARTLWKLDAPGLHWVVVRGFEGGDVVFNDPADGSVSRVSIERFWQAWRLSDIYRSLPMVAGFEALAPDRSLPIPLVAAPHVTADSLPPR